MMIVLHCHKAGCPPLQIRLLVSCALVEWTPQQPSFVIGCFLILPSWRQSDWHSSPSASVLDQCIHNYCHSLSELKYSPFSRITHSSQSDLIYQALAIMTTIINIYDNYELTMGMRQNADQLILFRHFIKWMVWYNDCITQYKWMSVLTTFDMDILTRGDCNR